LDNLLSFWNGITWFTTLTITVAHTFSFLFVVATPRRLSVRVNTGNSRKGLPVVDDLFQPVKATQMMPVDELLSRFGVIVLRQQEKGSAKLVVVIGKDNTLRHGSARFLSSALKQPQREHIG
jgi:hypothetical protein